MGGGDRYEVAVLSVSSCSPRDLSGCVAVNVCSYKAEDPCNSGHCMDDGRGLFRCLCADARNLKLTTEGNPICVGSGASPFPHSPCCNLEHADRNVEEGCMLPFEARLQCTSDAAGYWP